MIVVGTVAVLSTAGLLALQMVLRGSAPDQRPALLWAVADHVRAWRRASNNGSPQPPRQMPKPVGRKASIDGDANVV